MKHWPFKIVDKDTKPLIEVEFKGEKKIFTPEEVSSMVLMKMRETAEAYLGTKVANAVVTVRALHDEFCTDFYACRSRPTSTTLSAKLPRTLVPLPA